MFNVPWQDCVRSKSCPFFCVRMACVQNMALALHGENQGSRGEACNT